VIAYESGLSANGSVRLANDLGQGVVSNNLGTLLDWLITPRDGTDFHICWDIDHFCAPVLKLMPVGALRQLFARGKTDVGQYFIIYNQGKSLFIGKGGQQRINLYWVGQYYRDEEVQDLQEVKKRGEQLIAELASIGIRPKKLTSPVTLFEDALYKLKMPTHLQMPVEVNRMAWKCSRKQWTEAHVLGHFEYTWDYDLNSAFPGAMAELLNCSSEYGDWVHEKAKPLGAVYGFLQGMVDIRTDLSPIVYADAYGHQLNPRDVWPTCITAQDLQCITELEVGGFETQDSWWFVPKKEVYPARQFIRFLYGNRSQSPLLNRVLKLAQVGLYGKTLQTFADGAPGGLFCPVWGALVESVVRCQVMKFVHEYRVQDNVLHISTDGILLDKQVNLPASTGLGSWRLDNESPALIVSSGTLFYGHKKPAGLTYSEAMELVQASPEASAWSKGMRRRMVLGDYIASSRAEIGEVKDTQTSFALHTLSAQHDRHFAALPKTGTELLAHRYTSTAHSARRLAKGDNI